ncbi:hypothetical protein EHM69_07345 [candidate division KSB1 bacterium]|nr:MAG: hypothetical protein EHM69_07345 [candidate division KSB1 bacterium]
MKIFWTILLSFCAGVLLAAPFEWTTFTSTSSVSDMTVLDGTIWTATSGGLAGFDPASGAFDIYTNTRGLAMNQCVAIGKDAHGYIWAGFSDSRITRVNPVTGDVKQVVDLAGEVYDISAILDVGDEVFVAGNNGVYRFSYYTIVENYRVRESIRVLGTFPGETRVNCLAAAGGYLYAGTAIGIARASLSHPQLSAPAIWENWTTANSPLPENYINILQGYDSLLIAATWSWIITFRDSAVVHAQVLPGVANLSSSAFAYAATETDVYRFHYAPQDPPHEWRRIGSAIQGIRGIDRLAVEESHFIFLGLRDTDQGRGGVVSGVETDTVIWDQPRRAPGIGGNYIGAMAVDPGGKLWVGGSGLTPGVYVRDGDSWTNYSRSSGRSEYFFGAAPTGFVFDNHGGAWAASLGRGAAWFHGDSITYFNGYDSTGFALVNGQLTPRFSGIGDDPYYMETYITRSTAGDVFFGNLEAASRLSVVGVSHDWIQQGNHSEPWTYFSPKLQGQYSDYAAIGPVIADGLDRVWAGAGRNGTRTFVIDINQTVTDTSDDYWWAYRPGDRRDPTSCLEDIGSEVLSWTIDQQGYLWIGTTTGAYYTQGGVPYDIGQLRFVCVWDLPVGERVNAIHVDVHDNKWFGTNEGVAVLDKNFMWIHVFQTATSTENRSGLVSKNVLSITSNSRSGEVWIGTADGLSRYESPYVSAGGDLADLWPYPNPFRADGSQRLRVDPVKLGGRFDDLRVYTISGRLVRKLTWAQMTDPRSVGGWDGRNDDGELVAGGVYLMVATSTDGKSAVGKVAVLGR